MTKYVDWKKPLRVGNYPATLVREDMGNYHITWDTRGNGRGDAFVDARGELLATLHAGRSRGMSPFVENVPEEPKNCIVMLNSSAGTWFVGSSRDSYYATPVTRTAAEAVGDPGYGKVIVEVPVKS